VTEVDDPEIEQGKGNEQARRRNPIPEAGMKELWGRGVIRELDGKPAEDEEQDARTEHMKVRIDHASKQDGRDSGDNSGLHDLGFKGLRPRTSEHPERKHSQERQERNKGDWAGLDRQL